MANFGFFLFLTPAPLRDFLVEVAAPESSDVAAAFLFLEPEAAAAAAAAWAASAPAEAGEGGPLRSTLGSTTSPPPSESFESSAAAAEASFAASPKSMEESHLEHMMGGRTRGAPAPPAPGPEEEEDWEAGFDSLEDPDEVDGPSPWGAAPPLPLAPWPDAASPEAETVARRTALERQKLSSERHLFSS